MVRSAKRSTFIPEERSVSRAALQERRCGEFILCRRAQAAGPDNDVPEGIAVFHADGYSGIHQARSFRIRRAMQRGPQTRESGGQPRVLAAVSFDRFGQVL